MYILNGYTDMNAERYASDIRPIIMGSIEEIQAYAENHFDKYDDLSLWRNVRGVVSRENRLYWEVKHIQKEAFKKFAADFAAYYHLIFETPLQYRLDAGWLTRATLLQNLREAAGDWDFNFIMKTFFEDRF